AGNMFDEMCQLYPCLTDEVTHIVDEPAVLERLLLDFDGTKARALDSKIVNLRKELTEAIMESAKRQNLEVPKVWQCPCTKLQPSKSRTQNESILLSERLDKIEGAGVETQEQLKRMEREMAELKKSSKVIRCDSAASAPHSVVAEKQFSGNVLQRKIEPQGKLPHCKNRELLPKTRLALKSMPRVRREKIDAESQILHDVEQRKVAACAQQGFSHDLNVEGGKEVFLLSYVRPHRRVAKATLQTSCTSTIVGDKELGPGCCLVLVNQVLDGKAPLIRPLRDINTMDEALGHSIAWTRQQIQDDTTAAMVAPNQASPGQKG
uniref:Transposase Tnp1/En/Spm-like domain-containing protein n=1 Tax=Aegilops tauschii subsp. strangulata TaxID=200361 RepID=A0A453JIC9_AEGTS